MEIEQGHPLVSVIMGSVSDWEIMKGAVDYLEGLGIPFELMALSAHRTPDAVATFAREARARGVEVIIAGAGGAAHLPGVIAAYTDLPVLGVPIQGGNHAVSGLDAILSILQMPAGVPVATMALNGAKNAAIFATQILGLKHAAISQLVLREKYALAEKVTKANQELDEKSFEHRIKYNLA